MTPGAGLRPRPPASAAFGPDASLLLHPDALRGRGPVQTADARQPSVRPGRDAAPAHPPGVRRAACLPPRSALPLAAWRQRHPTTGRAAFCAMLRMAEAKAIRKMRKAPMKEAFLTNAFIFLSLMPFFPLCLRENLLEVRADDVAALAHRRRGRSRAPARRPGRSGCRGRRSRCRTRRTRPRDGRTEG